MDEYPKNSLVWPSVALSTLALLMVGTELASSEPHGNQGIEKAQKQLRQNGYSSVEQQDTDTLLVNLRGCGPNDYIKYEFTAVSQDGKTVDVIACQSTVSKITLYEQQ